jgi:hypothetical protein
MRHIIPISGKDSLATAIVQVNRSPEHDYEFVFNPTGLELPEVFEWIDKVGAYFGKEVAKPGRSLREIIEVDYNYFLPGPRSRYCTKESKIKPFVEWVGGDPCYVYYGIRADEEREGFNNQTSKNIIPVYTLKEMGINLEMVYVIVNKVGLKPPTFFWQRLYDEVKRILGYDPKKALTEWLFDMLFAWRSRTNCDRCFNQRYYEWVGLLEHHPPRFWEAESWEHKGGDKSYSWSSNNKFLKQIAEEADAIFKKRVDAVVKIIRLKQQAKLFDNEEQFIDVLAVKSCGLFCGK